MNLIRFLQGIISFLFISIFLFKIFPIIPIFPVYGSETPEFSTFCKALFVYFHLFSFCYFRFFRSYPYFQCMFPKLQNLEDENEMRLSEDFEAQAMMMFALFDDVVEALHDDLDPILDKLTDVARLHAKMEGFHSEFFKVG